MTNEAATCISQLGGATAGLLNSGAWLTLLLGWRGAIGAKRTTSTFALAEDVWPVARTTQDGTKLRIARTITGTCL